MEYISGMEKAIEKTLAYYDIFNFPLKVWEIHKWMIGLTCSLKQVEKKLSKMRRAGLVDNKGDYWFLPGRKKLVRERLVREKVSADHLKRVNIVAGVFKMIPWVKLVGVSGSLAMMGSRKTDDIDLFIITGKNRIWTSRLLLIFLTELLRIRRKRREKLASAAGKVCINLILENDNLTQSKKNIYVAHEVLQLHVLWQKDDVYSKFLHNNSWAFRFLPNWKSGARIQNSKFRIQNFKSKRKISKINFIDVLENLAKDLQLRIMNKPSGEEKIETGALYFHPEDKGKKILEEYKKRISN